MGVARGGSRGARIWVTMTVDDDFFIMMITFSFHAVGVSLWRWIFITVNH